MTGYSPRPEDLDELPMTAEVRAVADRVLGPTREAIVEAGFDPDDPEALLLYRLLYGDGRDLDLSGILSTGPILVAEPFDDAAVRFAIRLAYQAVAPSYVRLVSVSS